MLLARHRDRGGQKRRPCPSDRGRSRGSCGCFEWDPFNSTIASPQSQMRFLAPGGTTSAMSGRCRVGGRRGPVRAAAAANAAGEDIARLCTMRPEVEAAIQAEIVAGCVTCTDLGIGTKYEARTALSLHPRGTRDGSCARPLSPPPPTARRPPSDHPKPHPLNAPPRARSATRTSASMSRASRALPSCWPQPTGSRRSIAYWRPSPLRGRCSQGSQPGGCAAHLTSAPTPCWKELWAARTLTSP